MWASPRDAGASEAAVTAFAEQLAQAHVNTLVMEVKNATGLYWPSQRFTPAVAEGLSRVRLPVGADPRVPQARRIAVHAWFFDFAEGADAYVVKQHPEWLARNPEGKPSTDEVLRGRPYRLAWMCPARRPGYTDQWLIPVIEEFAARYDVDGIHHDYVRYPGDLAPDTYCFCDFCLEAIPRYASYYSPARPDDPLLAPFDRPHLEAHWEKSPKVLPPNWKDYGREMKSRLLLEGSFFPGGNRDLDYFFYEYRAHHVALFVRQVKEAVARDEAEGRVLGGRVPEPGAERPLHRPGLAPLLGLGRHADADGLPRLTTRATSRRTSTCWPRTSSSRRSGRATSAGSGSGSPPRSSTTRSAIRSCACAACCGRAARSKRCAPRTPGWPSA